MKNRTLWIAATLLLTAACGGGGDDDGGITTPPPPTGGDLPLSAEVSLNASSFSPSSVTIAKGGTVKWVNTAAIAHTVTPDNPSQTGVWASQNIPAQNGATFSHTFGTVGTYEYECQLHSGMTGTVRVQ